MFQLAKQKRYRRRRRMLRKLFWLQLLYSTLIFVSLVLFLIETIILNQTRLSTYHRTHRHHLTSADIYRRVVLSCAALAVWCCLYSVLMCYLIGYRASVASSIVHSALVGSYLVVWVGSRMVGAGIHSSHILSTGPAPSDSLISLSVIDCVLVTVQLGLGVCFVGMKRHLYQAISQAAAKNNNAHAVQLSTVGGDYLPACPTAQFNGGTEDIDVDNDEDQKRYQQDLDRYYQAENFECYSQEEMDRMYEIDRLCYLIP